MRFSDGDVICFLGDSITANGLWVAEVYQTLRKQYKIKCFNCGVSGGSADKASEYLYSTCLTHNPDYVPVFFGINDIERWFYSENYTNPDKQDKIQNAIKKHKDRYENIVKRIIEYGAQPILCLPTPYDEYNDKEEENLKCQCGMNESVEFVKSLAKKYNCSLVDFTAPFLRDISRLELIGPDRVHPTTLGQHYMAQIFLKTLGVISEIDIDTPFEFEDWNKKRYDAEHRLHSINYVEFCDIFWLAKNNHWNAEQKKAEAQRRIDNYSGNNPFIVNAYRDYIDNIDFYREYAENIIRFTV